MSWPAPHGPVVGEETEVLEIIASELCRSLLEEDDESDAAPLKEFREVFGREAANKVFVRPRTPITRDENYNLSAQVDWWAVWQALQLLERYYKLLKETPNKEPANFIVDPDKIARIVEALEASEKATREMKRTTEPAHWLTNEEVKAMFGAQN